MKTIQIAPKTEEFKLANKHCIIAEWDKFRTIITLPNKYTFAEESYETYIKNIQEAIALSSKTHQVEELLTTHWKIKSGKVTVENYTIK